MTAVWLGPVAQWLAFIVFALLAAAGGLGMVASMSMFRRGIFLMISFIGVAGLFLLLLADLLALLQIMMYVGGMLVMILFMVLFARDPGGARMAGMKMSFIEQFFSLGIKPEQEEHEGHAAGMHPETKEGSPEIEHRMHAEGGIEGQPGEHEIHPLAKPQGHEEAHEMESGDTDSGHVGKGDQGMMEGMHMEGIGMHGMNMKGMSMTTPIKRLAATLAILTGALLISLLWLRPAWTVTAVTPDPRSAERIGSLLMSKYMIAFEGASLLILTGIFGAVLLARSGRPQASLTREDHVAVEEAPPSIEAAALEPIMEPGDVEPVAITEIQKDGED